MGIPQDIAPSSQTLLWQKGPVSFGENNTGSNSYSFCQISNINIEGMTFSCSSIGIKIGSGVGTALVGWLLAFVGYNGKEATDSVLTMIRISYLFVPVILGILLIVCFLFMNVEEENKKLREAI